jgi:hypothetical protein
VAKIQVFSNDEYALVLGCATSTHPVSALPAPPMGLTVGCHVAVTEVLNPLMGMSVDTHVSRRFVFFFVFNAVAKHRYVIETTRKDTGKTVDRYSISIPVRTLVDYDESGAG